MRHLVIDQRQKAPNFSAFHWSPHGCLITIGQHFVTTRVVHLPKRTETSYFSYARSAQPGPNRTRLCGPCIAAKAGSLILSSDSSFVPPFPFPFSASFRIILLIQRTLSCGYTNMVTHEMFSCFDISNNDLTHC